jgi:hypothetical protein
VRQLWHFRWLAAGLVQERLDASVPGGAGGKHRMPWLDVRVGWRGDGQFECLVDELAGTGRSGRNIEWTDAHRWPARDRTRTFLTPMTWPVERVRPLVPRKSGMGR